MDVSLKELYATLFYDWDNIPTSVRPRGVPIICPDRARVITAALAAKIMAEPLYTEWFHIYNTGLPEGWAIVFCRKWWEESNEKYWQLKEEADSDRATVLAANMERDRLLTMAKRVSDSKGIKLAEVTAILTIQYEAGEQALEAFCRLLEDKMHMQNLYIPPQ